MNYENLDWCYIKQIMNAFNSCDGTAIFIQWEMKCSIQLGFASSNRTFHLSPHENICTIALITIHYLYTIRGSIVSFDWNQNLCYPTSHTTRLISCDCLFSFNKPRFPPIFWILTDGIAEGLTPYDVVVTLASWGAIAVCLQLKIV